MKTLNIPTGANCAPENYKPFALMSLVLLTVVIAIPSAQAQFKTLYNFKGGSDGGFPYAGLVMDAAGNLYGTTWQGGKSGLCTGGCGTVFKVDTTPKETVLHSFSDGADGVQPVGGLILDAKSNLYGTASWGGDFFGSGTVFELTTTGKNFTTLYTFTGGPDGAAPYAGLVMDTAGNLYGTTNGAAGPYGDVATVFEVDPTTKTKTNLHTFTGVPDGNAPQAGLVMDAAGNLYGTTRLGGDASCNGGYGCGTVFEWDATTKTEIVLYSFTGKPDGKFPYSGYLVSDAKGNLYGTTESGGASGLGVVFKLDPTTWKETILHSFTGKSGGAFPEGGLVMDAAGNLYGTTSAGGTYTYGTIFELSKTGTFSVLHSFDPSKDGGYPQDNLILDSTGKNLYGTCVWGGSSGSKCGGNGCGTVFKFGL